MTTTKTWEVTFKLIQGYYDGDNDRPILKTVTINVDADDEKTALSEASKQETSLLSVWEMWATQIS